MPATCEPEGYTANKRKGNVRSLRSDARARFVIRVGYVDNEHAPRPTALKGISDDSDNKAADRGHRQQHG